MGHSDLIRKLESLPPSQRRAVEALVETLAAGEPAPDRGHLASVLAAARGSWPSKMSVEQIDSEVEALRAEWLDRP